MGESTIVSLSQRAERVRATRRSRVGVTSRHPVTVTALTAVGYAPYEALAAAWPLRTYAVGSVTSWIAANTVVRRSRLGAQMTVRLADGGHEAAVEAAFLTRRRPAPVQVNRGALVVQRRRVACRVEGAGGALWGWRWQARRLEAATQTTA